MKSNLEVEVTIRKLGIERYWHKVRAARAGRRESDTDAGRYLLREAVGHLSTAIEAWCLSAKSGGPGRSHTAVRYLSLLEPDVAALIIAKSALDSISLEVPFTTAALNVGGLLEDEVRCRGFQAEQKAQWGRLKRSQYWTELGEGRRRKAARRTLRLAGWEQEPWPKRDKVHLGAACLELMQSVAGLTKIINRFGKNGKTEVLLVATEDTLKWIEKAHEAHEALTPFYLPEPTPPNPWTTPFDGGYHTSIVHRRPLVKTFDKSYLEEIEKLPMPEVYAAVNTMQNTAWRVNKRVAQIMREFWKSDIAVADLGIRVDEPLPPKPEDIATNADARRQWRKAAASVYARNGTARSRRMLTAKTLFMADQFGDSEFYYPYQLDFRGRCYPVPYFLQPQGASQSRGLLEFANGGVLETQEQVAWLAIHGANKFGVDKVPFEERIAWVADHEEDIRAAYRNPQVCQWWATADSPWEFLAFCMEWGQWIEDGRPLGRFVSRLPIAMDGSNNGLQLYSLLLRDPVGAAATNVLPSTRPQDIYQDVADIATARLKELAYGGSDDEVVRDQATKWLAFSGGRLPRSSCKRPVMTLPYGSTNYSCQQYVVDWYEEARTEANDPFGRERYQACLMLAQIIWGSIGKVVVAARAAMQWLHGVAKVASNEGIALRWMSPAGFPVKQFYTRYEKEVVETSFGAKVRRVGLRKFRDEVHPRQQGQGVAPNFIHSLDASVLMKTVNLAHERGIDNFAMIHDSFGVLAADAPLMASTLREVVAEMFSGNLLEDFRNQVAHQLMDPSKLPPLPAQGVLDPAVVKDSPYFFA